MRAALAELQTSAPPMSPELAAGMVRAEFNGDPHPGNYLFRPDGHVTFLDFGLVKYFTQTEVDVFGVMIQAMVVDHDPAEFRRIVEDIDLLRPDMGFTDAEVGDYFGHFYDFVMTDGDYTITPAYASETVRRFFDTSGPYGEVMKASNVPPFMVIIQRINLGLYAMGVPSHQGLVVGKRPGATSTSWSSSRTVARCAICSISRTNWRRCPSVRSMWCPLAGSSRGTNTSVWRQCPCEPLGRATDLRHLGGCRRAG